MGGKWSSIKNLQTRMAKLKKRESFESRQLEKFFDSITKMFIRASLTISSHNACYKVVSLVIELKIIISLLKSSPSSVPHFRFAGFLFLLFYLSSPTFVNAKENGRRHGRRRPEETETERATTTTTTNKNYQHKKTRTTTDNKNNNRRKMTAGPCIPMQFCGIRMILRAIS